MITLFTGRFKKWLVTGDVEKFRSPIREILDDLTDEEMSKVNNAYLRIGSFIGDAFERRNNQCGVHSVYNPVDKLFEAPVIHVDQEVAPPLGIHEEVIPDAD